MWWGRRCVSVEMWMDIDMTCQRTTFRNPFLPSTLLTAGSFPFLLTNKMLMTLPSPQPTLGSSWDYWWTTIMSFFLRGSKDQLRQQFIKITQHMLLPIDPSLQPAKIFHLYLNTHIFHSCSLISFNPNAYFFSHFTWKLVVVPFCC